MKGFSLSARRRSTQSGLALTAWLLFGAPVLSQHSRSLPSSRYSLEGLEAPVEILVDRWGIPHIYAGNLDDVFFAQGFNAARDRLWQLDLWKRRGEGSLSEVLGADFVDKDRAAKLFLYRGDTHAEWLAYGSDTKRVVTSFVAGVNAYIGLTRVNADLLPLEFKALQYLPAFWAPETVVRIRSHGLFRNVRSEVKRARFLRDHGRHFLWLGERLRPAHEAEVPAGLDLALIPDDVLKVYELATEEVEFPEGLSGRQSSRRLRLEQGFGLLDRLPGDSVAGSNNWAVAASRSATGRPVLANDPHRDQSVPSLRYIVHLVAPGLNVIGAGEPALPGVSIGHNERVAFGLTVFAIDQEDLFVYKTHPQDPSEYWYRGRWEPMNIVGERVLVRGAPAREVELKFTRHGPVIYQDRERNLAFAVRAAWLEPGMAPYLGSLEYMRAQNWDQFLAAMNRWGAPAENQVYADVEGMIGWKPGGLAPVRPDWDGLLPVAGDGSYEWAGFRDMDELPVELNPERGWIATANQMNLPPGYPHPLGFEWALPYRHERISDVLGAAKKMTLADMLRLQTDYLSVPSRRLVRLFKGLTSSDSRVERALNFLGSWDSVLRAESGPAALFEVWYRRFLGPAVMARVVSGQALLKDLEGGHAEVRISLVENPDARLGPDPISARDQAIVSSLREALEETEKLMGKDWESWRWGDLHQALLEHPLSALLDDKTRSLANVGPAPRGGSGETVGNTGYRVSDFRQTGGASFRMVLDVGAWDNSLVMNSPGQSGDPNSPHYRDLFPLWAKDEAFPFLYSRARVVEEAGERILLEPAK